MYRTLWWAELDRLHSITRAHPPLGKGSANARLKQTKPIKGLHFADVSRVRVAKIIHEEVT